MANQEPHRLAATDIVRLIEAGELTAEAVVRSCLDRIRERDPVVRAWAYLDREAGARRGARTATSGGRARPAARACRSASRTFSIPPTCRPATARRSIPAAGRVSRPAPRRCRAPPAAILLGKTVTTEFANRHPGPTSQPAQPDCTRRAARRAARRRRSPISWCRWRSARRPAAR